MKKKEIKKVKKKKVTLEYLAELIYVLNRKVDNLAASTARQFNNAQADTKDRFDHLLSMIRLGKDLGTYSAINDKRRA